MQAGNSLYAQQDYHTKWSLLSGYEVNYMGNNAIVHAQYTTSTKHILEAGINYNFSDGFAENPVIGLGFAYGYKVLQNKRWNAVVGVDYRRQKPLAIVNVQTLLYTTSLSYQVYEKWSVYSRVGYGMAAERARSAGAFSQSNNITGSLSLGCVFQL